MVVRHECSEGITNVILVDFKRRRRIGGKGSGQVKVTSFGQDLGGAIPRSFRLDSRLILVWEVLDRWPGQDYKYLKIRSVDDVVYFLRHDLKRDEWYVIE